MNNILYTFIIPHKNTPQLLERCVNSIPQRKDIEIIIVDDNSDIDKKPQYEKGKALVIYLDATNSKGAGHARNVGIKHAHGKWLLFADSDDHYVKDFISILDQYAHSNKDIVFFNTHYKDAQTLEELARPCFMQAFDNYDGTQEMFDIIRFRHNSPWPKMISSSFINRYAISFEESANGNDMLFTMLTSYFLKEYDVIKEKLYIYYRNPNGITHHKESSYSSLLCKTKHLIQQNIFFKYIGHNEWQRSWIKDIISRAYRMEGRQKFSYLIFLAKNIPFLYTSKKEWIERIEKIKTKYENY